MKPLSWRRRTPRLNRGGAAAVTAPPSVTESDAEALVAKPVQITVKRDIRSGRHGTGVLLLTRVSPCEHRVRGSGPAAVNTVGRSRWCGGKSGRQSGGRRREHRGEISVPNPHF